MSAVGCPVMIEAPLAMTGAVAVSGTAGWGVSVEA